MILSGAKGMFVSPIAYSNSLLPEQWRWVYGLNPMMGVIEGFRWALLGRELAVGDMLGLSVLIVCLCWSKGSTTSAVWSGFSPILCEPMHSVLTDEL